MSSIYHHIITSSEFYVWPSTGCFVFWVMSVQSRSIPLSSSSHMLCWVLCCSSQMLWKRLQWQSQSPLIPLTVPGTLVKPLIPPADIGPRIITLQRAVDPNRHPVVTLKKLITYRSWVLSYCFKREDLLGAIQTARAFYKIHRTDIHTPCRKFARWVA
jgi:hypothetical protein